MAVHGRLWPGREMALYMASPISPCTSEAARSSGRELLGTRQAASVEFEALVDQVVGQSLGRSLIKHQRAASVFKVLNVPTANAVR